MANDQKQKIVRFEEVKNSIVSELKKRNLGISEPVTLIDGFINQPIVMELSNSFMIGGPTVPLIMLFGKNSGRVYYVALKAILADIEL